MNDQLQTPADLGQRQNQVLLDELFGNELAVDLAGHIRGGEIDILHPVLVGERLGDLIVLREPEFNKRLAHALARALGLGQGLVELLLVDEPPADEDLTDFLS